MEPLDQEYRAELVEAFGEELVQEYETLEAKVSSWDIGGARTPEQMADCERLDQISDMFQDYDEGILDEDELPELDKEFYDTVSELNGKLNAAAVLLEEAAYLANKAGLPTLINGMYLREHIQYSLRDNPNLPGEDLAEKVGIVRAKLEHVDLSDIEGAVESLGWSTSSSYC